MNMKFWPKIRVWLLPTCTNLYQLVPTIGTKLGISKSHIFWALVLLGAYLKTISNDIRRYIRILGLNLSSIWHSCPLHLIFGPKITLYRHIYSCRRHIYCGYFGLFFLLFLFLFKYLCKIHQNLVLNASIKAFFSIKAPYWSRKPLLMI